jgi:hypothetical protein
MWLSQRAVNSINKIVVSRKGRNVVTEKPPASEDTTFGIKCRCNVSVPVEEMKPIQIIQLHGSNITVFKVTNNSVSFNLFHVFEVVITLCVFVVCVFVVRCIC